MSGIDQRPAVILILGLLGGIACTAPVLGDDAYGVGDQQKKGDDDDSAAPPPTQSPQTKTATQAATVADAGAPDAHPPVTCPENPSVAQGGHCYFVLTTNLTFDGAVAACAAHGSHIVSLSSAIEQTTVATLLPNHERWIGLRRPNGAPISDATYAWTTGEPRGFANWSRAKNEPDGQCANTCLPNAANCARMLDDGTWADDNCVGSHPVICERE
jgi:hypothetical protein